MNKKQKHLLISIEGNIGSGKSTLLRLMHNYYQKFRFIDEPVQEWQSINGNPNFNLLKQFYDNPHRWAYTMQVYAFYSRLKHWKNILEELNPEESAIILSERSIEADRQIFAINGFEQHLMNSIEFAIYEQFYNWITSEIFGQKISKQLIIYLKSSANVCHQRLNKRGRSEEKNSIQLEYLEQISDRHEKWLNSDESQLSPNTHVLVINGDIEFESSQSRQLEIFEQIDSFLKSHQK